MSAEPLISSKEILQRQGISRATLNNYIRLGIIPRPVVKNPGPEMAGTKKIGYFPLEVEARINKVKTLKAQGYSMDEIVLGFQDHPIDVSYSGDVTEDLRSSENTDIEAAEMTESPIVHESEIIDESLRSRRMEESRRRNIEVPAYLRKDRRFSEERRAAAIDAFPHPDRNALACPAYLLNERFDIVWMNDPARALLMERGLGLDRKPIEKNILRLCLKVLLEEKNVVLETLLDFHSALMKVSQDGTIYPSISTGLTERESNLLGESFQRAVASKKEAVKSRTISHHPRGSLPEHIIVHAVSFGGETLILLERFDSTDISRMPAAIMPGKERNVLSFRMEPVPESLCVLWTELSAPERFSAELPSHEYLRLIGDIGRAVDAAGEAYGGLVLPRRGCARALYFFEHSDSRYLNGALRCAMKIQQNVREISRQWKDVKGWDRDILLHLGISEGSEYVSGSVGPDGSFTCTGATESEAEGVARASTSGAVMVTKGVIEGMSREDRSQLRFGIGRKGPERMQYRENLFARLGDLDPEANRDMAHVAVAEIIREA
ncbi:MAG: hypothetical protein JXO48_06325 [Deltaproteobacteria bacterium]|nr:hypothetical protein [Deltaproteobacteria bacterium]